MSESKELFHSCFKNISARTEILQVRASINLVLFHLSDKHLQRPSWCWQCDRIGDTVVSKAPGACLMELPVYGGERQPIRMCNSIIVGKTGAMKKKWHVVLLGCTGDLPFSGWSETLSRKAQTGDSLKDEQALACVTGSFSSLNSVKAAGTLDCLVGVCC